VHWIIGDIHGMLGPLETLLAEVDRRDPQRQLIFAGDYVNRGPDSKRVVELLMTLKRARFARGNHDDVLDQVIHDTSFSGKRGEYDRIAAFKWFMNFGLFQTFRSYGVSEEDLVRADERGNGKILDELASAVPASHREFVSDLRPVVEERDFFVVHAKWDVRDRTESPSILAQAVAKPALRQTIVWGRFTEDEIASEKAWGRRGYFGHTPVTTYSDHASPVPIVGEKIVLVDTGCVMSEGQRLTAYCHESGEFIQAHASGRLVTGP
jgi:serine/threonine protein phosphatase 1